MVDDAILVIYILMKNDAINNSLIHIFLKIDDPINILCRRIICNIFLMKNV